MCSCDSAYLAWRRQLHFLVAAQHCFLSMQAGASAYVCVYARSLLAWFTVERNQLIVFIDENMRSESCPPCLALSLVRTVFCLPLPDIICVIIIISCFSLCPLTLFLWVFLFWYMRVSSAGSLCVASRAFHGRRSCSTPPLPPARNQNNPKRRSPRNNCHFNWTKLFSKRILSFHTVIFPRILRGNFFKCTYTFIPYYNFFKVQFPFSFNIFYIVILYEFSQQIFP